MMHGITEGMTMADMAKRPCDCKSDFQDKKVGRGIRLHTVGGTRISPKYTCTVCGKASGYSKK